MSIATLALCAALTFQPQPQPQPQPPTLPFAIDAGPADIEIRSGFWINLHHVLWAHAFVQPPAEGLPVWHVDVPDEAAPTWADAVEFYKTTYANRALLRDRDLQRVDIFLADVDDAPLGDALADYPDLAATLQSVAPIYREHAWPDHQARNRRHLELLVSVPDHAAPLAADLARVYDESWPEGEIIVELVVYANWAGAYTTYTRNGGLIRMAPPRQPGVAIETLWHESSHLLLSPRSSIGRRITEASERLGARPPRDLWHVILFEGTSAMLRRHGISPADADSLAAQFKIYDRSPEWSLCRDAVNRSWPAYLDGDASLDQTIDLIVGEFTDE